MLAGDAVVAAGRHRQLPAALARRQAQQLDVQVAAGVQGHGGLAGLQVAGGAFGEHVLLDVHGAQPQAVAQALAVADQRKVALQAQQRLPAMGQQAPEVALAGAPVQPLHGGRGEVQAAGEGLDLLPFAPGHVDLELRRQPGQRVGRQVLDFAQLRGAARQLREGRRRGQAFGLVVRGVGLFQVAPAQPGGQFPVFGFPGQFQQGEGLGPPQPLVGEQEGVQGLEALEQDVVGEAVGHGGALGVSGGAAIIAAPPPPGSAGQRPCMESTRSQRSARRNRRVRTRVMTR